MDHSSRSGWYWLSASVVLVSFAQLILKYAMAQLPGGPGIETYLQLLDTRYIASVTLPIVLGLAAYTISVFCWLATLSRLPLSLAYPSLALSYLLVFLGGTLLPTFHEELSVMRLAGVALVVAGVFLVGRQPVEMAEGEA